MRQLFNSNRHLIRESFFGFFRFVCFRKRIKTSCISMKINDNEEMNIVDFGRHKLIAFLITVGSIPLTLTSEGIRLNIIKFKSY